MTLEEVMQMARAVGLPVEYANIGEGIMCGIIPPNGLERFANACFAAGAEAERGAIIEKMRAIGALEDGEYIIAIRARSEK